MNDNDRYVKHNVCGSVNHMKTTKAWCPICKRDYTILEGTEATFAEFCLSTVIDAKIISSKAFNA